MLFTFPSQYWYTIGLLWVFSLTGWSPLFQTGFLVSRPTQDSPNLPYSYLYGIITLYDVPFQKLPIVYGSYLEVLLPRICRNKSGLGYFLFARHYLGNRFFFLFLRLLRCFSSAGCSQFSYVFTNWYLRMTTSGFPHSDIPGSKLTYSSPRHFVVCHVLHQLLVPSDPHVRPY